LSSDTAVEQFNWLLKGCGISLPTGIVNTIDLIQLSAITFAEFNMYCPIIELKEEFGHLFERFSSCIENIKHNFQYPQYCNGLMGLLLLFSYDRSYNLLDSHCIKLIFEECKELVVIGYEDFEEFGTHSVNKLISTLREMSDIFRKVSGNHFSGRSTSGFARINEEECFENKNGIRTQIKPVDCSVVSLNKPQECEIWNFYHLMPLASKFDCANQIEYTFNNFVKTYGSVVCGACLTIRIGKLPYHNDSTTI
jgi:hypothetical protein